ncbi:MAG: ABC transporter permease [Candidatus Bathyarchaeia archaeon]|jgi:lipopolysaccharide transport system permease protein
MLQYAELIRILTIRDFRLRYQNSILGFLWSLLNPLAMMIILWVVFAILVGSAIKNFPLFILPTILAYRFFQIGTGLGLWSIVNNASLVTRVYFPRWLLVLSSNLANLLGTSLEFAVMFPVLLLLGMKLEWTIVLVPALLAIEFALILGTSLFLAALNVRYRDLSQVWDITLQLGFYLSPILYDVASIPQRFLLPYSLNPMAGILVSFRKALYYGTVPNAFDLALPVAICGVMILLGTVVFRRLEPRFAEEV